MNSVNTSSPVRPSEAGFTLLEVLLAVSILVIVVTVVYRSLFSSVDAMERTRQSLDLIEQARLVFSIMEADLEGAYSPQNTDYFGFNGVEGNHDEYPADRLDFISTTNLRLSPEMRETDLAEIGYYLVYPEESDMPAKLFRRVDGTPDRETTQGGREWELLDGVMGMSIEYFSKDEWLRNWQVSGKNFTLPTLVRVTLVFKTDQGTDYKLTDYISIAMAGL